MVVFWLEAHWSQLVGKNAALIGLCPVLSSLSTAGCHHVPKPLGQPVASVPCSEAHGGLCETSAVLSHEVPVPGSWTGLVRLSLEGMCLTVSSFQVHRRLSMKCSDRHLMGWAHDGRVRIWLRTPTPPVSDQVPILWRASYKRVTLTKLPGGGEAGAGPDIKASAGWALGAGEDDQRQAGVSREGRDVQSCEQSVTTWAPPAGAPCPPPRTPPSLGESARPPSLSPVRVLAPHCCPASRPQVSANGSAGEATF